MTKPGQFRYWALALLIPLLIGCAPPVHASTNVRGSHARGQTWIVWQETAPIPSTYDIYKSTTPFSGVGEAQLVGRLYPQEWGGERLKLAQSELEFVIPDGQGGTYTLLPDEGLFVYTPHTSAIEYFAVVKHGETTVAPEMISNAVSQACNPGYDPVTAHVQWSGPVHGGFLVTIYTLWIDGRNDGQARPDFPVMGNGFKNGTPHIFSVAEPPGGVGGGEQSAVLLLHGGDGQWVSWRPGQKEEIGIDPVAGYTVQHDDAFYRLVADEESGDPTITCSHSWWFGYYEHYNPFVLPPDHPPADGVVRNFTVQRLEWISDWLITHRQVDPARITIMGHSMGGTGAGLLGRFNPQRYGSVTCFNPTLHVPSGTYLRQFLGSEADNLSTNLTNLAGDPVHMRDVFHPECNWSPSSTDYPFTRYYLGRDDTSENACWNVTLVDCLRSVDAAGCGAHIYWDGRPHMVAEWDGHWSSISGQTARDDVSAQGRYRSDRSYPSFFGDDQNLVLAGRQPDPGDGDPGNGYQWGTWGGYFDWETETITDRVEEWACTLYLVGQSSAAVDNCPVPSAVTDLVIRKPQQFRPGPGEAVEWALVRLSDGVELQAHTEEVGSDGLVAISALTLYRDPVRCRLRVRKAGKTVSAALACEPAAGNVPFSTRLTVTLANTCEEQTRRIAGHIDVTLGGGGFFQNWRRGFTNVAVGESYIASWHLTIPDLTTVHGENRFLLLTEDVTPAPYNQPPYPPAGYEATGSCTVLAQ